MTRRGRTSGVLQALLICALAATTVAAAPGGPGGPRPTIATPAIATEDVEWAPFTVDDDDPAGNTLGFDRNQATPVGAAWPTGIAVPAPAPPGVGQVRISVEPCQAGNAHVDIEGTRLDGSFVSVDDVLVFPSGTSGGAHPIPKILFASITDAEVTTTSGQPWCQGVFPAPAVPVRLDWVVREQQVVRWNGTIAHLDQLACDSDEWFVIGNGQPGTLAWDAASSTCQATMGVTATPWASCDPNLTDPASRGVYFPLDSPGDGQPWSGPETDHHFWLAGRACVDFESHTGTNPVMADWNDFVNDLPYDGFLFPYASRYDAPDPDPDLRIRYLLIELGNTPLAGKGGPQIVDRVRVTYWMDEQQAPDFRWFDRNERVAGAWAMLSPAGLAELADQHERLLPYPSLRAVEEHGNARAELPPPAAAAFSEVEEPLGGKPYWTSGRTDWQGYRAWVDIRDRAAAMWVEHELASAAADAATDPVIKAILEGVAASYCVRVPPLANHFAISVNGASYTLDETADPVVTFDDVTNVDLEFGDDRNLFTNLRLVGVEATLDASLLDHTRIVYDRQPLGCFLKPRPSQLADATGWTENDPEEWLTCRGLVTSGDVHGEIEHLLRGQGERVHVRFEEAQLQWSPAGPTGQNPDHDASNAAACEAEDFAGASISDEMSVYDATIVSFLELLWGISPGQDEALDRLLSPLEIGVEREPAIPPDVPEGTLYRPEYYDLDARISPVRNAPHVFATSPLHGLYVPYVTAARPHENVPKLDWDWLWPCILRGSNCGGDIAPYDAWLHSDPVLNGRVGNAPFHVATHARTSYINQTLWAQAHHPDLLGSPADPHIVGDAAVLQAALDPLSSAGRALEPYPGVIIRMHATVPPFVRAIEDNGQPSRLLLLVPQVVVELHDEGGSGLIGRFIVDLFDHDLDLAGIDGAAPIASFGDVTTLLTTVTFPHACSGALQSDAKVGTCEGQLQAALRPILEADLLASLEFALENRPVPGVWDSADEALFAQTTRGVTFPRQSDQGQGFQQFATFSPFLVPLPPGGGGGGGKTP